MNKKNKTPKASKTIFIADEVMKIMGQEGDMSPEEVGVSSRAVSEILAKKLQVPVEEAAKKVSTAFCGKLKNEVSVVGNSRYEKNEVLRERYGSEIKKTASEVEMYLTMKESSCIDTRVLMSDMPNLAKKYGNHYLLKTILLLDERFQNAGKIVVELVDSDIAACSTSNLGEVFLEAYEEADEDGLSIADLVEAAKAAGSAAQPSTVVPLMGHYQWEKLPGGKGYCPPGSALAKNIKDIKEHGDYHNITTHAKALLKKMPKGFYIDELRKISDLSEIPISDILNKLREEGYPVYGKRIFGVVFQKGTKTGSEMLADMMGKGMSGDDIMKAIKVPDEKQKDFKKRLSLLKYLDNKDT